MEQEKIKQAIIERFNNLQPEIQAVIMSPDYEKNLSEISTKYKLTDDQIKQLELNTTLVLLGQTHPDEYAGDLLAEINLPKDTVEGIVNDVKEKILKNIIEIIKGNFSKDDEEEEAFKDLPLPPSINNPVTTEDKIPAPTLIKTPALTDVPSVATTQKTPVAGDDIYKNAGIEIVEEEKPKAIPEISDLKNDSQFLKSGINMIRDKMDGVTVSKNKVTDYSLPKISGENGVPSAPSTTSNSKDPYHEAIE